jgi:hypothetical protein
MYKYLIVLIIIILLITYNNENFTGFRKWGFLTETENNPLLFPWILSVTKNQLTHKKCNTNKN